MDIIWQEKLFEDHKTGNYLRYLSHIATGEERQPLLLHIHGAGSRGEALDTFGHLGPVGELDRGRAIGAHIVAPQYHADTWFELFETLIDFARQQAVQLDIDPARIYLCGSGMYWNAACLKENPIWAFHGALDCVVLPEESLHMVRAVNDCGGNARLTILPHAEHNAWDAAFASDELWSWLFQQRKSH